MSTARKRASLVAALCAVVLPADAHHSPAAYDLTRDVRVEGRVTSFSWRNPHVYIEVQSVDTDGKAFTRLIEAAPAAVFAAMGYDENVIKPGDYVTIVAKRNRGGADRVALGWRLTKFDGTIIPLHARAMTGSFMSIAEATSIAGSWVPKGTDFAKLAVAASGWPLTAKGRAAVSTTRAARLAARSGCVPYGPPALMALPAAAIVEVTDTEVTFTLDAMNARRVVYLHGRRTNGVEPTALGHSIGHWEDGTLVVETSGFSAQPEGYAFDLPSSAAKRVVERFSLSADRKHLDYEATVEDPEYLAAPVTHRSQWDYRQGLQAANLPCDPEAARRFATDE